MSLNALGVYARQRGREIGLSMADLARRAGVSRQTLHTLGNTTERLPEMLTLVKLAAALRVHPLQLVQLAFENYPLPYGQSCQPPRGQAPGPREQGISTASG